MTRVAQHYLQILLLLIICSLALVSCSAGSRSTISISIPGTQLSATPARTSCGSCVTIGTPSFQKIGQGAIGTQYLLSFMIKNHRDTPISYFEIDFKIESQTEHTTTSNSQTISNGTTVPAHSQLNYKIGEADNMLSGVSLPYPPPSKAHVTLNLILNGTTLASWDGQVNVPASS